MKAFEGTLRKDTSEGLDLSGITIRFALAAEPRDANTDERQYVDIEHMNRADIRHAFNLALHSTIVVPKAQTCGPAWVVLWQRMGIFQKIVADIVEVSRFNIFPFLSEHHSDSPIFLPELVCYDRCGPGLAVTM